MKCHAFELLSKNCFYFLDLIISMYVNLSDHSIYSAEKHIKDA